ncbi:carboxymuconolactone decarboxylase family protein [Actibacterium sp.]|uniref:carboxymuconolactone decarboxylase family protein n=1 Tax=Actibacterium sp. TaxID=1872125 RepID=UPI003568E168
MDWTEKSANTKNQLRALNKCIPDATKGFNTLSKAVKDNGTLGLKEKEYVALGIAVAQRCDDCIVLHIEALIRCGATREEVGDVLAMSIQMGGGPALMYAARALDCFDQLTTPA